MIRGFLAHKVVLGGELYSRHLLYLTPDHRLHALLPFEQELAQTTFYDGLLLVVDATLFPPQEEAFSTQLLSDSVRSIYEAILDNPIYIRSQQITPESHCALYLLKGIEWSKQRIQIAEYELIRLV